MSNQILMASIAENEPPWAKVLTFGISPDNVAIDLNPKAIDYLLVCSDGAMVAIERKTPTDFLKTFKEKRLDEQFDRMLKLTPWSHLLITGYFSENKDGMLIVPKHGVTGWDAYKVWARIRSIQYSGITVSWCKSDADLQSEIILIGQAERGQKIIEPKRQMQAMEPWEKVLCAFPGMGYEKLQALKVYAGEPAFCLCAMLDDKTAEHVSGISLRMIAEWRYHFSMWKDTLLSLVTSDGVIVKKENDDR